MTPNERKANVARIRRRFGPECDENKVGFFKLKSGYGRNDDIAAGSIQLDGTTGEFYLVSCHPGFDGTSCPRTLHRRWGTKFSWVLDIVDACDGVELVRWCPEFEVKSVLLDDWGNKRAHPLEHLVYDPDLIPTLGPGYHECRYTPREGGEGAEADVMAHVPVTRERRLLLI